MFEGAVHQSLGGDPLLPGPDVLWHRAGVDPHPDGNMMGLGAGHHLTHRLFILQVARIDAQLADAILSGLDGQAMVKVNVSHQGDRAFVHQCLYIVCGILIKYRYPHQITAGFCQRLDLGAGRLKIPGIGVGHGLDADRGASADDHCSRFYCSSHR